MKSVSSTPPATRHPNIATSIAARFAQITVGFGVVAATLFVVFANLIVDIVYGIIDPRVRLG